MIDTSSNPGVTSGRSCIAILLSLIGLLSLGRYAQAAANRQVQENVFYGNRESENSKKNDQSIGHIRSAGGNDLSARDTRNNNSPALNGFLENVLKAQNELKWIDQAVRNVDAGEKRLVRFRPGSDRFGRRSDAESKAMYQARIRVKRDLEQLKRPDASWVPQKKRYDEDYSGFPERIYLDNEMKIKREVEPENFQEDIANAWASGTNDKLDPARGSYKVVGDRDSRDSRHLDSRQRKFARMRSSAASQNSEEASGNGAKPAEDPPSLESLKRVVLELSKSLTEPDTKTETKKESVGVLKSRNAERHVEEIAGRKEGASKGEHERDTSSSAMNRDTEKVKENIFEKNYETNSKWWEDPRSAAEIFDFGRRDDDLGDDEEDEEVDGRNSEFDYVMRRVKRDRDDKSDDDEIGNGLGVFYRAGFGEYYHNDGPGVSHRFRRESNEDPGDVTRDADEDADRVNYNDKIGGATKVNSDYEKSSDDDYKRFVDSKVSGSLQDQEKNVKDEKVGLTVAKTGVNVANEDSVGQEELLTSRNKKDAVSNEDSLSSQNVKNVRSSGSSVGLENLNSIKNESLKIVSVEAQLETHDAREQKPDESSKIAVTVNESPKEIQDTGKTMKMDDNEKSEPDNTDPQESSQDDKKSKDDDTFDVWHVPENGEIIENSSGKDNEDKKRGAAESQEISTSKRPIEASARIYQVQEELSGKNGAGDNIPGKLISTIFDIKVEKAQLGSDGIAEEARPKDQSVMEDKMRIPDAFDLYKDKDNLNIKDSKVSQDDTSVQDSSNSENRVQQHELSEDENKDHVKSTDWYADPKQSQEKIEKEAAWYKEISENDEPKDDIKEKINNPEKSQEERVDGPASDDTKYRDKEYNKDNYQSLSSKSTNGNSMELSEETKDPEKDAAKGLNYKDTKRKLLWVTSILKNQEIRDGRRDSGWDQKESGKHEQGPVNVKENIKANSLKDAAPEFATGPVFKDDLYIRESSDTKNPAPMYVQRRKRKILQDAEYGPVYQRSQLSFNRIRDASTIKRRSQHPKVDHKEKSELDGQGSNDLDRSDRSLSAGEKDSLRDKVNMLIRQRIDTKVQDQENYVRGRRYPLGAIEYYDYDGDSGEYDKDSPAIENEQKLEVQQPQQPQQANSGPNETIGSCNPKGVLTKKDEYSEEEERERKQLGKLKNKVPTQEFIADIDLGKGRKKISNNASKIIACGSSTPKATINEEKKMYNDESERIDQSDDNVYRGPSDGDSRVQWLGQSAEANPDPRDQSRITELENRRDHVILAEPLEYSLNVHGKLEPEAIGAFLGDGSPVKQRLLDRSHDFHLAHGVSGDYEGRRHQDRYQHNEAEEDVQPTYEELEKINEWKQSEIRDRPRMRGDHRLFGGPETDAGANRDRGDTYGDRAARRNWYSKEPDSANLDQSDIDKSSSHLEQFSEQISKGRRFLKEAKDEVPKRDSQDMPKTDSSSVPDQNGSAESSPGERTYLLISSPQSSGSSNPTTRGSSSSSPGSNYLALKITDDLFKGGIEQSNPADDKTPEILGPLKTTTEWKVIKTDSRSPYENQEIFESSVPENDNEKNFQDRSSVGSKDLVHESFVEPLDLDSEDDIRIRLGRGLMGFDDPEMEDLHSFSYPADDLGRTRTRRAVPELEWQEAAIEKYLKNSQDQYFQDGGDRSLIEGTIAEHKFPDKENDRIKRDVSIDPNDRSTMNFENLKNPIDIPHADQGSIHRSRIGKGLTNVEEWEMNAPILQKHIVSPGDHVLDAKRIKDSIEPVSINGSSTDKDSNAFEETSSSSYSAHRVNTTLLNRDKRNLNYNQGISRGYGSFGASNIIDNDNAMNNYQREKDKSNGIRQSRIPGFLANTGVRISPGYVKDMDLYGERKDTRYGRDMNLQNEYSPNNVIPNFFEQAQARDYQSVSDPWSESNGESAWFRDQDNYNNYRKQSRSPSKKSRNKDKHSKHSKVQKSSNRKKNHRKHHPSSHHPKKKGNSIASKNSKNHNLRSNFKNSASSLIGNLADVKDSVNIIDRRPLPPTQCKSILQPQMSMLDNTKGVHGENNQGKSTPRPEDDCQKKKFTVLLAPDNMEDESQMDLALHGELAGKIVERIFDQVQRNEALKIALGPGLYRKHKPQDAITSDKIYRQGLDEDEVKHTETMMRRVMELLGRLILDEVQRKTCASLPPDMRDFLQWMLGVEQEESFSDQAPPLPLVHDQDVPHHSCDKFLFHDPFHNEMSTDINELYKKVRLLKSLIGEYNALTEKEKTRVQTVHDYLVRQLGLLVQYIEAKEAEEGSGNSILRNGDRFANNQHTSQYQNLIPNTSDNNNQTGIMGAVPTLSNTPGIIRLSNTTFQLSDNFSNQGPIFGLRDKRREIRSSQRLPRRFRKRKRKRKHKHKHGKHKHSANQSPEYRKLIRRIASLRQKRANSLYRDNWDPFESGYEEPIIYSASGMLRSDSADRKREAWGNGNMGESEKKYERSNFENDENPYFSADHLAESYNENDTGNDKKFDEAREKNSRDRIQRRVKYEKNNRNSQNDHVYRIADLKNNDLRKSTESHDFDNEIAKYSRYDGERANLNLDNYDGARYDASLRKSPKLNSPVSYAKQKRQVNNTNKDAEPVGKLDNHKNIEKTNERKRDVLSTSINLQPWLDPKSKDDGTSDFLKKFSNQLARTSNVISRPMETYRDEGEKRDALKVYEEREPSDAALSGVGAKNVERSLAEKEVVLLNKREAWKRENEQQLEEVAFGKDMRSRRGKEEFEKLAELDERKKELDDAGGRKKRQDKSDDESKMAEDSGRRVTLENSSQAASACRGAGPDKNLEMECKSVDVEKPRNDEKSKNFMTMEVNIFQVVPANSTKINYDRLMPKDEAKNQDDYTKSIEDKINVYSDEDVTQSSNFEKSAKQNIEKDRENKKILEETKSVYENESNMKKSIITKNSLKNDDDDDPNQISASKAISYLRLDVNGENLEKDLQKAIGKTLHKFNEKSFILDKRSLNENEFPDNENNFWKLQNDKVMLRESRTSPDKDDDSVRNVVKRNGKLGYNKNFRSRKDYVKNKRDPAVILPLLEVSEQRQMQSQASRAQKDDQRDIADQILGLETP